MILFFNIKNRIGKKTTKTIKKIIYIFMGPHLLLKK